MYRIHKQGSGFLLVDYNTYSGAKAMADHLNQKELDKARKDHPGVYPKITEDDINLWKVEKVF